MTTYNWLVLATIASLCLVGAYAAPAEETRDPGESSIATEMAPPLPHSPDNKVTEEQPVHPARWDPTGDHIKYRLDRRGDRINDRLDRRADRARDKGLLRRGDRLDDRGDRIEERIDRRLDRHKDRIDRRLDRHRDRHARRHHRRHHHQRYHRHHRPVTGGTNAP